LPPVVVQSGPERDRRPVVEDVMEVILREDVDKLGRRGDVVKVAEGYGRNFLLPRGLALAVTDANKAMIEKEKRALLARLAKEKAEFQAVADRIGSIRFVAPRKVGENDVLYGSVTSGDIAEFLKAKGIELDKRKVQLEEPIKKLGDHEVHIKLHPEVTATLKVLVSKEG
jgi:large subunit ribosomal protein L9